MFQCEDVTPGAHSGSISSALQSEIERRADGLSPSALCTLKVFMSPCRLFTYICKHMWTLNIWPEVSLTETFVVFHTMDCVFALFLPVHFTSVRTLYTTSLNVFGDQTCGQTVSVTADSRFHQGGNSVDRIAVLIATRVKDTFLITFPILP